MKTSRAFETLFSPPFIFVVMLIAAAWLFFAVLLGSTNPDSFWCCYKIYKQPNGTYEVWWVNKTSHCEKSGMTYEQAKAFQIQECKDLESFVKHRPKGERVK